MSPPEVRKPFNSTCWCVKRALEPRWVCQLRPASIPSFVCGMNLVHLCSQSVFVRHVPASVESCCFHDVVSGFHSLFSRLRRVSVMFRLNCSSIFQQQLEAGQSASDSVATAADFQCQTSCFHEQFHFISVIFKCLRSDFLLISLKSEY